MADLMNVRRDLLIRFVKHALPGGAASEHDPVTNIVRIDQYIFDMVDERTQRLLWRARKTVKLDLSAHLKAK